MTLLNKKLIIQLIIVAFFGICIGFGAPLTYNTYQTFKIAQEAQGTVSDLQTALQNKDFDTSTQLISQLDGQISTIEQGYALVNRLVPAFIAPEYSSMRNSVANILAASKIVTGEAQRASQFIQEAQPRILKGLATADNKILALSKNLKNEVEAAQSIIIEANRNIERAQLLLAAADVRDVPQQLQDIHTDISEELNRVKGILAPAEEAIALLPELLAFDTERRYLILLMNNTELRPVGGFIGNYGIMTMRDGAVTDLYTDDVYNIDWNADASILPEPPQQLADFLGVEKWFFRDSNWDPDFINSAEQALFLYDEEVEGDQQFDGVIALTPYIIGELLDIFGGVTIEGTQYTKENFIEILQYQVEFDYVRQGIAVRDRKVIINTLTQELFSLLSQASLTDLLKLAGVAERAVAQKDALFYSRNEDIAQELRTRNWDGDIQAQENPGYFMLVDANLGSLKTDRVMQRRVAQKITEDEQYYNFETELFYYNQGDFDWRTTRYISFSRVLLPTSAQEIKFENDTQHEIGLTSEYKYIGFEVRVEPQQTQRYVINYKIPKVDFDEQKLRLYLQKQAGSSLAFSIDAESIDMLESMYRNGQSQEQKVWFDLDRDAEITFETAN